MGLFDRLMGNRQKEENIHSTSQAHVGTASQRPKKDQWVQFFSIVKMEKTSADALQAYVGRWPDCIDPGMFSSTDLPVLLLRISDYQKMKYPFRNPNMGAADFPLISPTYKLVDGKIARASTIMDTLFWEVVPPNIKSMYTSNDKLDPGQIAWKLIKYYSEFPLARLIFLLPFMCSASEEVKKGNKTVIVVIEDLLVEIYKGVENILFDTYSDLPVGGILDDMAVTKKLCSLIGL